MDKITANTKTEKGLQYLNLLSMAAVFVFLILLQTLSMVSGQRIIVWIGSIIFTILNLAYYVVPANYKLTIIKRRILFVYLPALIIIGISIWDFFSIVLGLELHRILSIAFTIISVIQALTFAALIAKISQGQQALLS